MLKILTTRPLYVNILAAVILLCAMVAIFMLSLNWITKHGKTLFIPAVTGMSLNDAKKVLDQKGFDVEIQDSVYFDTVPALNVIRQFPEADAIVKKNRTVYLTINRAIPPTIDMPKLVGLTFRNAEFTLRQYGLKLQDTSYRIDFAKNSVLDQLYNDETIKPGARIQMGSPISLVLGTGVGAFEFTVPDLIGLTFEEAKTALQAQGLSLGLPIALPDVKDSATAYVYRQSPQRINDEHKFNRIRGGQTIDLWLSVQKPERHIDSTNITPNQ